MKIKRSPEEILRALGATTRVRDVAKSRGVMVGTIHRNLVGRVGRHLDSVSAALTKTDWETTRVKHAYAVPTPDLAIVRDLVRSILDTAPASGHGAAA